MRGMFQIECAVRYSIRVYPDSIRQRRLGMFRMKRPWYREYGYATVIAVCPYLFGCFYHGATSARVRERAQTQLFGSGGNISRRYKRRGYYAVLANRVIFSLRLVYDFWCLSLFQLFPILSVSDFTSPDFWRHYYTLSEARSGVDWADLMAAQGAFGTDFHDKSTRTIGGTML